MQEAVRTVWIARHGNRQDFVDLSWHETAALPFDPGLSPDGVEQARRLAQRLRHEPIAYIFASPFLRTVQTAHEVAAVLDLPVYLEPGLGEWLNPAWFPAEPERHDPAVLADRFPRVDLSHVPVGKAVYPEPEEATALTRAGETARRLVEAYPSNLLMMGHGVSVAGAATGLVPGATVTACPLCSLFKVVRRDDAWHLDLCADVSHLDEALAANRFA